MISGLTNMGATSSCLQLVESLQMADDILFLSHSAV